MKLVFNQVLSPLIIVTLTHNAHLFCPHENVTFMSGDKIVNIILRNQDYKLCFNFEFNLSINSRRKSSKA